jgi:hypothetical protein
MSLAAPPAISRPAGLSLRTRPSPSRTSTGESIASNVRCHSSAERRSAASDSLQRLRALLNAGFQLGVGALEGPPGRVRARRCARLARARPRRPAGRPSRP